MKTVKIFLFSTNDLIGNIVKLITHSKYSHVGIVLDNYYYDSTLKFGVKRQKIYKINKASAQFEIQLSEVDFFILHTFLKNQIGKKYDILGAVRFMLPWLKQENNKWFCSELVVAALKQINIHISSKSPSKTTPADIYNNLSKSNVI